MDVRTLSLVGGVLVLLAIGSIVVHLLRHRSDPGINHAILETFRLRVRSWWLLFTALAVTCLVSQIATVIMFGLIAFWALREFITLTPTRPGDHRTLFWVFFLVTPLQFLLVALGWYELQSILIPVYVFLFIPARIALAGDPKRFLERVAKIQVGVLICVYCLSFAPALMSLKVHDDSIPFRSAGLLIFFVLIVQLSDALQYAWSQIPSRHLIVKSISPNRTWEGLIGGTVSVTFIGAVLWWATPFPFWLAGLMSTVIAIMGFAGCITMSAIKRDRGVQDYGTLVQGHGGVLDRIDSLCFAAPVFYYLARWWMAIS
jgi:phosphatidate cytidylyltransferase